MTLPRCAAVALPLVAPQTHVLYELRVNVKLLDHATARSVIRRPRVLDGRVRSQSSPCDTCGGQSDSATASPSSSVHFTNGIPMGRDSSVGIATRYGLDGPGIESRWGGGEIFPQPSLLYNGYPVFPGGKAAGAWC